MHKAGQVEPRGQGERATTVLIFEHQSMMVLEQAPATLETDSHKAGQVKLRRSGKGNSKKSKKRAITVLATAQIRSPLEAQKSTMVLERVQEIQGTNRTTKTDLCSPLRSAAEFVESCGCICESHASRHTQPSASADDSRERNMA